MTSQEEWGPLIARVPKLCEEVYPELPNHSYCRPAALIASRVLRALHVPHELTGVDVLAMEPETAFQRGRVTVMGMDALSGSPDHVVLLLEDRVLDVAPRQYSKPGRVIERDYVIAQLWTLDNSPRVLAEPELRGIIGGWELYSGRMAIAYRRQTWTNYGWRRNEPRVVATAARILKEGA